MNITKLKYIIVIVLSFVSFASYKERHVQGKLPFGLYVVESDSMNPSIRKGDVVVASKSQNVKISDVVVLKYPFNLNRYITHRIIGESTEDGFHYISQGDANNTPDPWKVDKDIIVGKIIFIIPYLGYVVNFIRTPVGLFSIVVIPLSLIFLHESDQLYSEVRNFLNNPRIVYKKLRLLRKISSIKKGVTSKFRVL